MGCADYEEGLARVVSADGIGIICTFIYTDRLGIHRCFWKIMTEWFGKSA